MENMKFDREKAIYLIDCVLDFFSKTRPLANSESRNTSYQDEILGNFNTIIQYKREQVEKLIKGKKTFEWQDVMKYVSCPLDVETSKEIDNYGLKTKEYPNGVLNESLSRNILKYALMYRDIYLPDGLPDDMNVTLPCTQDVIDHFSPNMIKNNALLVYMFMTGRGKEFAKLFGNNKLLKDIDSYNKELGDNPQLEFDLKNYCVHSTLSRSEELDSDYLKVLSTDLKFIKSKISDKVVDNVPVKTNKVR